MKKIFRPVPRGGFLFVVFCAFATTNPLCAQLIQTNAPYDGFVTSSAVSPTTGLASSTNLFAGTYLGDVFLSTDNGHDFTSVGSDLTTPANVRAFAVRGTNTFANRKAPEVQFAFIDTVPEYRLTIYGLPTNNILFIGGRKISENKNSASETLRRGVYVIEVEAQDYERYSTTVELSSDRVLKIQMFSWSEVARHRLPELEAARLRTRISILGELSIPVLDFGYFVSRSPGYGVDAQYESEVGRGIALLGGTEYLKWSQGNEFNINKRAWAIALKTGFRAYWDLSVVRLFGLTEIGFHILSTEIEDRVLAIDSKKGDTNLSFAFGIGGEFVLNDKLSLDLSARDIIGQPINLFLTTNDGIVIYEINNGKFSYVGISFGVSYTLTD